MQLKKGPLNISLKLTFPSIHPAPHPPTKPKPGLSSTNNFQPKFFDTSSKPFKPGSYGQRPIFLIFLILKYIFVFSPSNHFLHLTFLTKILCVPIGQGGGGGGGRAHQFLATTFIFLSNI